jgi:hypothetical protein
MPTGMGRSEGVSTLASGAFKPLAQEPAVAQTINTALCCSPLLCPNAHIATPSMRSAAETPVSQSSSYLPGSTSIRIITTAAAPR